MRRLYFFIIALFLSFGLMLTDSVAKSKTSPDVPITQIEFVGGKLVQENWSQGVWVEYDFRGTRRYEFLKTGFDDDILTLKGTKGDVTLVIDIPAKTISGKWPGFPMQKLYDVTRVTYLSSTKQPRLEEVVPNTIPPEKKAPTATPPKKEETLSTDTLSITHYKNGSFYKIDETEWREENDEGTIFRFRNIGSDAQSLFLYDIGREILIELDIKDQMARISHSGEKLQDLYQLTDLISDDRTIISLPSPKPPLTPIPNKDGQMNAAEKADCLTKGGFIERAGMLGFERCTIRYSDGGNICIDSSNCEGKCLASVEGAQNKAVSGQCQATDNPFGCYAEVIAGTTGPALCVD
jgi:hypothetical protein